tara:strand:- start:33 stop:647 length:615 start_codon:yes stop_codon:yes gene_type:complete
VKKLEILATPFDDPSLCRFTVGETLVNHGSFAIKKGMKTESKLAEALFNIKGIVELNSEANILIVRKDNQESWREIGPSIGATLRNAFERGMLSFPSEEMEQGTSQGLQVNKDFFDSTELGKKITQTLELKISPSLGAHGGSVTPVDFRDGVLFLSFSGGCQGCSQASVTVRDGILRVLKSEFEEIKDVVDITDHTSGSNPYFK